MVRRLLVVVFFSLMLVGVSYGQSGYKFAHIASQDLIASMPERDSAMAKLKAFEKEIMEQMDQLNVEVNKKYQDYIQKRETLTPALREAQEKSIGCLLYTSDAADEQ